MAKKTTPEVKEEQKVITRYDRKMAARKAKEEKDRRDERIFKIISSLVGIVIVLAIVIGIATTIINKQAALKGTYIQVGDREVSQLEFDYYYNASVNNYINTYGSLLAYMGLDTTQDFADQEYGDGLTWKDYFDQMAVQQMTQVYALIDDAQASGFTYDVTAGYEERALSYEQAAETAGISVSEYYKSAFGQYATVNNIAPFIENDLLATAYYNDLLDANTPSAEEIQAYYEDNVLSYDKVDCRSFIFTADIEEEASDEDIAKAMDEIEKKANAFMEARKNGSDFEELCIENASEDAKADYEDEETEYSLSEGWSYAYTPSAIRDWLYDDARKEGDIEVIESESTNQYYVVEFVSRYYDAETSDPAISELLSSERTTEYISGLMENYEVTDTKGKLKYLTVDTAENDADAQADDAAAESDAEAESTEEGSTEDAQ